MNADMLAAFDRLRVQVDRAYEATRDCLTLGDLTGAQKLLARLGDTHAKAALLLGQALPPCVTCAKDEHDGTEDHPMARTYTGSD
ncbi:hypothetical protein ABZU53_04785 [Micromonospora sp. NPDC005194]|uniref:hypothetical protein n=1 Tax=Micromonospora sp. NPDC005194 TaxID=3156870 RepID=UPI0033BB29E3